MISLLAMLVILWGVASASEIVLYQYLPSQMAGKWWALATMLLLLGSSTGLLFVHTLAFAPLWLLGIYRLINLQRVVVGRLSQDELQHISQRAVIWLIVTQVLLTAIAWLLTHHHGLAQYALDILVGIQLLSVLVITRVTVNTWRHTQGTTPLKHYSDKDLPSVSVLVPARNETNDLEVCLRMLIASDYPKLEIIVLDDCSTSRRTPEIIRSFAHDGVRFIPGSVPDEKRWLAKNWAYHHLANEASGDLLLFCGVDVQFAPNTIRALVELMLIKEKDMMSMMPLRDESVRSQTSLLQPMRYYWELCLPRRFFKRPPVLSTCWLIKAAALRHDGGFESVSRSITPEAHFARRSVIGDHYSFIRADEAIGLKSIKPANEQYTTTVRTRYPQLHRRLELVAITTILETVILLGPLLGLLCLWALPHALLFGSLWLIMLLLLAAVYWLVSVKTRLNSPAIAWLLFPFAIAVDIAMLHISLWRYEFGTVDWKGRNVCIPVMKIEPHLPRLS